ncbi:conserved hypothetical protein [Abyssogena phaseoliformis symbiont OG214]|uniref:hypothetical protein n=1 Tax=Abyssogena phaseoliformis symbiont TaxID=596095 RepID=UPI001916AABE|nr:hypothetical protein [Abyssogena phaseoliformis symbiont]MBW5288736.1 hypothetical protein [Candidatus Ruthia sp. Apha_13_S6]BBB22220.1 conserved hypothetical protein [Abyssogena phaseoliformis symbiont OG214]
MCQYKTLTNLASFAPSGGQLGQLFTQAKAYNQINIELAKLLPSTLKPLELCLIKDNTAILITHNQAIAFRAQKQLVVLLELLTQIPMLESITHVEIKININK